MYYVNAEKRLVSELLKIINFKAKISSKENVIHVHFEESAGFPKHEDLLSKEELDRGVYGGGLIDSLDGKKFIITIKEEK